MRLYGPKFTEIANAGLVFEQTFDSVHNGGKLIREGPMAGKRGNGEGSIDHMKDGRWHSRISTADGQRAYIGRTRADVASKLAAALTAKHEGRPILTKRSGLLVGEWLTRWLAATKPTLKPRVYARYEQVVRLHVTPFIGEKHLSALAPEDLRALYEQRQTAGQSAQSVHNLHGILHCALGQALREGKIYKNVTEQVKPPRVRTPEMKTLDQAQAQRFLAAVRKDRLEALFVLALTTGMREGELLGLQWEDVNIPAGTVSIKGSLQRTKADGLVIEEPKTRGSRRNVTLSHLAKEALLRHRERQWAEKLVTGPTLWRDQGIVFANTRGGYIEVSNLLMRSFYPLLEKAELPKIRFHDLRHTAATLMLLGGVHPKIVAEMLGHSRVGILLDRYSHILPTMQADAAKAFDALLTAQTVGV